MFILLLLFLFIGVYFIKNIVSTGFIDKNFPPLKIDIFVDIFNDPTSFLSILNL